MDIHGNSTSGLVCSVIAHIWLCNGHELNIVNLFFSALCFFIIYFVSHQAFLSLTAAR